MWRGEAALNLKRVLFTIDTPKVFAPLLSPKGSHLALYRQQPKTSAWSMPNPLSLLLQPLPARFTDAPAPAAQAWLTGSLFPSLRRDGGASPAPSRELALLGGPPVQTGWTACSRYYLTLGVDGCLTAFVFDAATGDLRSQAEHGRRARSSLLHIDHAAYLSVADNAVSFALPCPSRRHRPDSAAVVMVQDHRGVLRLCGLDAAGQRATAVGQWPGRRYAADDEGGWIWDGDAEQPTVVGVSAANDTSKNPFLLLVGRRRRGQQRSGDDELTWQTLCSWNVFERTPLAFKVLRFAPCGAGQTSPTAFYAIDARGVLDDKACLVRVDFSDVRSVAIEVLARHHRYDVSAALFDPLSGEPVAVGVNAQRMQWLPIVVDERQHKKTTTKQKAAAGGHDVVQAMVAAVPGDCDVVDVQQTASGRWLLHTSSDSSGAAAFLFDGGSPTVRLIDEHPTLAERADKPSTRLLAMPVAGADDDGKEKTTTLDGYLTLPGGDRRQTDGRHPLLVMPHGGPCDRDSWEYNALAQFYAAAGLAVLRVNYLGSAGYGRRFETRVYGRLGTDMTDSLLAATRWCLAHAGDVLDAERVAIFGGSAGGYLAMSCAIRAPELFRCAAAWNGFFSLPSMVAAGNQHTRFLVGDESTAVDHSILTAAGRIRAPILLLAGGADPLVHYSHSVRLNRAVANAGGRSQLLVFPSEGHDFRTATRLFLAHARLLAFLHKHVGLPNQRVRQLDDLLIDKVSYYLEHAYDIVARLWSSNRK